MPQKLWSNKYVLFEVRKKKKWVIYATSAIGEGMAPKVIWDVVTKEGIMDKW